MIIIKISLFVFFITLFLVSGYFAILGFLKNSQSNNFDSSLICPRCGKILGTEKTGEKLIGIFRKNELRPFHRNVLPPVSAYKMAWHEKYRIHYKCRYCGHEVIFVESRKQ